MPKPKELIIKEIRNKKITVRYTESELKKAHDNSQGALASWLRDLSLLQKPKQKAKPVNRELLYELNKIGVNLNQIARMANTVDLSRADKIMVLSSMAVIASHLSELREKYDS